MATTAQKKPEEQKENLLKRAGKWLWANKWGLLGAFATGAAAGVASDKLVDHFTAGSKKGGPTEPPTTL